MMQSLVSLFGQMDYTAIFILMAMESSILPVPSELVMIPAGWLVSTGQLDPILAILVWGIGSLVWATANYFILGRWIGKPFLEKYGKYIFISHEKYHRAEWLFLKGDKLYTFLRRLIPVVRHLISIPAGIFRMPIFSFGMLTFLGATLWCAILVGFGYTFGEQIIALVIHYTHIIWYIAVLLISIWIYFRIFKKK